MKRRWRFGLVAVLALTAGCKDGGKKSEKVAEAERPEKVREPAVVGMFYPADKDELTAAIDRHLKGSHGDPIANLRALICPHAGYRFSGPTAAFAYRQLIGRDVQTVIILAPSHYTDFEGASVADATAYRTPLGLVAVSPKADELAKVPPFVRNPKCDVNRPGWWQQCRKEIPPFGQDTPHTWEHSLEVQIPFLQKVLPQAGIVPVVYGQVDPKAVADALKARLDERTIVIASSDLSHFESYDTAIQLDAACIESIRKLDPDGIKPKAACGRGPIQTVLHLAKALGWKVRLLDYRNSGDTAGGKSSVVGYAAFAFYGEK